MLTLEENELLTRTGPGTPMGELMRRYWLPAVLSWELPEPDCPPVRVKLLGEALVMFRDTEGRIGLLDEFCAHRGTSLWLGRNEQSGLRCVWHGWKYDVNGQCVDQLNERDGTSFAQKIRIKSYPTLELGGVIWAYMGPPEKRPPPPRFGWTQVPETHRHASKVIQECNWLQGLEGGLDQSHVGILHSTFRVDPNNPGSTPISFNARGGAPIFDIEPTKFGHRYVAIRPLGEEQVYVRGYNFVMPFTQIRPYSPKSEADAAKKFNPGHMWVPIDDESCTVWNWMYSWGEEPLTEEDRLDRSLANGPERRGSENVSLVPQQRQQLADRPPSPAHPELHRHRWSQYPGPCGSRAAGPDRGQNQRTSRAGGQGHHHGTPSIAAGGKAVQAGEDPPEQTRATIAPALR